MCFERRGKADFGFQAALGCVLYRHLFVAKQMIMFSGCLIGKKNNSLGKETKELDRFKSNQRIYERIHDETFYEIFGAVDGARTRDHRRDRPVL